MQPRFKSCNLVYLFNKEILYKSFRKKKKSEIIYSNEGTYKSSSAYNMKYMNNRSGHVILFEKEMYTLENTYHLARQLFLEGEEN